jgi:amino acid adenylation domain-containing protein
MALMAAPLEAEVAEVSLPASFAQQQAQVVDRFDPGQGVYTISHGYHVTGPLDVPTLVASLNEIVRRHETLRTRFALTNGQATQIIQPPGVGVPLTVVDLEPMHRVTRDAEIARRFLEASGLVFDLATGPLFRVTLLRIGPTDHVLLFAVHHIVFDAWSEGIFLGELTEIYAAQIERRPARVAELSIQYADFAAWQREWVDGERMERQLAYWTTQLADLPPRLELPVAKPRVQAPSARGGSIGRALGDRLAAAVQGFSRRHDVTPFMTLAAAFFALLQRYTRRDDLVVGTPSAGRQREEVEPLIGCFVNTLALRVDFSDDPSFSSVVTRVREVALGALEHQDVQFDRIVEAVQPDRTRGESPIVQVMFVQHPAAPEGGVRRFANLTLEKLDAPATTAKFDLTLFVRHAPHQLEARLEYRTDLFETVRMEAFLDHFEVLLTGAMAEPERRVSVLPLLTSAERVRLLSDWSKGPSETGTLPDLVPAFEDQVARTPESAALVYGDTRVTYGELNRRANQLAHGLRGLGIGPNRVVGLHLRRSVEMIVGLLGVLKAGGAYLPLDPDAPLARLAFMLDDAHAQALVTGGVSAGALGHPRTVRLDGEWDRSAAGRDDFASGPDANLASLTGPTDLAYVIYTSGSTGQPKGCAVPLGAVRNYLNWAIDYYQISGDRIGLFTSLSFDLSVTAIFGSLLTGGVLHLEPGNVDPVDALRHCVEPGAGLDTLKMTPAHVALLGQLALGRTGIRTVIVGGEALAEDHVETLWRLNPAMRIHNEYGPTETTVGCLIKTIDRSRPGISVGRPIANTEIFILDAAGEPVPVGVPGEIYIGGAGLARGYLNRPELTAERFVAHPFHPTPGARLYRTGDAGRYRPDGEVDFLGRLDDQVKIRGVRVEPGEVTARLLQHPDVTQAVVVSREDRRGEHDLVAYVVFRRAVLASELRAFVGKTLPDQMVPSAFIGLDALPLTAHGKIDRARLPPPHPRAALEDRAARPPRTPTARALAEIWCDVLRLADAHLDDDFFEMGGHSMRAIQLFARIEEVFGRRLPVSLLVEEPTLGGLARVLNAAETEDAVVGPLVTLQPHGTRPPIFFLHGTGGEVLSYKPLARLLGADQPVYGLQADTDEHSPQSILRVEARAGRYIEQIRRVVTSGPILLGGFCSGATLAFEMARQLCAAGQEVALLAVIDHGLGCVPKRRSAIGALTDILKNLPRWVREDMAIASHAEWIGRLGSRVRAWRQRLFARLLRRPSTGVDVRDQLGMWHLTANQVPALEAHVAALKAYRPAAYPGAVTLFRARTLPLDARRWEPDLGWSRLAHGGVRVRGVPGSHATLLRDPFVEDLAKELRIAIEESREESHGRSPQRHGGTEKRQFSRSFRAPPVSNSPT